MLRSDEQWHSLTDAFQSAAIGINTWYDALEKLADATGSRSGQLVAIGADGETPLNVFTDMDSEALEIFEAAGGHHPRFNPRVKAGIHAPVLRVLTESDYLTVDEHKRNQHMQEFAFPCNVPYSCVTVLDRHQDTLIGLGVFRSKNEGHITAGQREIFAAAAPFVRAAVRTQLMLEDQGVALLTGTLEAMTMPAFLCDWSGRVASMTSQAEAMVASDRPLELRAQRLQAALPEDTKAIEDAIRAAAAATGTRPPLQTVVVRGREGRVQPMVVDVVALPPGNYEFRFGPRVLVVVRSAAGDGARQAILQQAYGVTAAESDVALQLSAGRTPEMIANERHVSVGTIRSQIKSILAKLNLRRQVELVAHVNRL